MAPPAPAVPAPPLARLSVNVLPLTVREEPNQVAMAPPEALLDVGAGLRCPTARWPVNVLLVTVRLPPDGAPFSVPSLKMAPPRPLSVPVAWLLVNVLRTT